MTISTPLVRSERTSVREVLELELLDYRYPALHGLRVIGIVLVLQYHVTQSLVLVSKLPTEPGLGHALDGDLLRDGPLLRAERLSHRVDSLAVSRLGGARSPQALLFATRLFSNLPILLRGPHLPRADDRPHGDAAAQSTLRLRLSDQLQGGRHLARRPIHLQRSPPASAPKRPIHKSRSCRGGWSLGVEEHFYLLVPFLFAALRKLRTDRARLAVLVTLWLSAFVIRLVLYLHYPADLASAYVRTHTRADTLAAGVIIAYVHHRWGDRLTRWLDSPAARAAIGVPTLGCLWILLNPGIFGDGALASVFLWGTISSLMYFGFVLFLLNGGNGWIRRALSAPLFRRIATLGYGVYLVHIPICYVFINPGATALVDRWGWSMAAVWPLSLAALIGASLVMAYVMHIVIEKPSLRLRDRVAG